MPYKRTPTLHQVIVPRKLADKINTAADKGVVAGQLLIDRITGNWPKHYQSTSKAFTRAVGLLGDGEYRMPPEKGINWLIRTGRALFDRCQSDVAVAEEQAVRAMDLLQRRKGHMVVLPDAELALRQEIAAGLRPKPKLSKLAKSEARALLSYSDDTLAAMSLTRWQLICRVDPKAPERLTNLEEFLGLVHELMGEVAEQQEKWEEAVANCGYVPKPPREVEIVPETPPARL